MNLVQNKLDVNTKKRANLFNWRGQFTPEFVEYIIETFNCDSKSLILDPFAGSGTVLIESAVKGISSVGFEINPAAFQMANFYKYSRFDLKERQEIVRGIELKLTSLLTELNGQPLYIDSNDYRSAYKNLINFAKFIKPKCSQRELSFVMNVLFASEKDKKMKLKDSILKSFSYFKNAIYGLPFTKCNIEVHYKDARQAGAMYKNQVDLIITSPPYINVFNYHQNYRAVTEAFDYNILKVAHSEFGSNRKNRGNRLLTVIQYCLDMEESLHSFWNSLKPNGKMVMIVGRESNVRKTPFYNGEIVLELINEMNCFNLVDKSERAFINKFGNRIIEDIIIVEKEVSKKPVLNVASSIAERHLKRAKQIAPNEVLNDFVDAVYRTNNIKPSPIFNL